MRYISEMVGCLFSSMSMLVQVEPDTSQLLHRNAMTSHRVRTALSMNGINLINGLAPCLLPCTRKLSHQPALAQHIAPVTS